MTKYKNIFIGFIASVLLIALGGAYYFFGPKADERMVVTNVTERITNNDLKFSFAFSSGETALSLVDSKLGERGSNGLLYMYLLMETKSLNDYYNQPENGETPPAITVLVFEQSESDEDSVEDLSRTDKIKNWAKENSSLTSFDLAKGEIIETEIDGIQALKYQSDGLYSQEIYIVKYKDLMYLFVGQYEEEGDYLNSSFASVVESIWFD